MGLIKMNGKNYWGSSYGQGIIAPMIYSTEEKEVGVWQDGKPLYKRTYSLGSAVIINANTWTSLGIDGSGIDTLVDKECLDDELRSNDVIYCAVRSGYINVYSVISTNIQVITILYTKTTDTAGSGIYTPSGALAVHYSTNEQVIGTWIDGKPLYERTFGLTQQLDLTQNTWVKSELDQGTMKGLFYVLFTNDLGACLNNIVGGFIDNKIAFNSPRTISFAIAENAKVTLQYTKTTDV